MAQSNWEADKMLDVYIHDYLLKRKLHASAKAFMTEGKVATDPVAIDAPGGFLFEWWSVFWDIFIARTNEKHSEAAAAYIEAQQIKAREQQQLQMQQLQLMQHRNVQLQRRDSNHPALGGSVNAMNSEGMMGQPSTSVLAMKMYEESVKHTHSVDSETSSALIDANRMALLKTQANHQGQLVQGSPGNMSAALQQIQSRTPLSTDIKSEVNLGGSQKSLPMDPSSIYGPAILQPKSGLGGAGLNQGVSGLPLRGWPLTGIDQLRPSLGLQMQKPNLQTQNQILLASQQQHMLAQAQLQGNLGNSTNFGDTDPRRFGQLSRGNLNAKDGQSGRNDGSICSPVQSSSPKMKMGQMSHSSSQQQDQLQQQQQQSQQVLQNNRKRKQHSSSGAANSTGTGNTVGPSPNSPPSTHTPGDAITTATSLQHVNSVSKSMIYGADATAGLTSSSNMLEDIDRFDPLDENMETLLSHDGGDGRDIYGTVKQSPSEHQKESAKGFTFAEFGCIQTRNSKVTCCHFSSDGKLLASAGHDKKVVLWNMDTLQTESTPEEHKLIITDVRFRPNSSQLATASVDKSVRLWDAANPSFCVQAYNGHTSPVMSLDFHPKKTDLFCFCDNDNEIRYWNLNTFLCTRMTKGGTAQVRFQPRIGHLLAAVSDKVVSIFDVESDRQTLSFQGHSEMVNYICWDANGDYLASVSHSLVKVWSVASGECIQELSSGGNQFHSCVFHPSYSTLLVIGGISSLELWNMAENKSMTIPAHENIVSALAQSPVTGMVASASHDSSVKLWK
ncbi:transcriptional corepressor LEUNIG_HOMOLOG-like [Herrania umbratica]|uniref:Transcriptional corepressor LEUNIG_HOMOLOG-like n=1 Tax=Herrania umbratica TaxID=108875 RepID=A0A6J1BNH7_9ROSI|nr:transcriptional corepressor LEUNIG_HOMOLOG-like [Herrania umbratica]XP_021300660.1 transcriptional corepressor LEUNIG_HOMOLOG-like [Herrania umbratica]